MNAFEMSGYRRISTDEYSIHSDITTTPANSHQQNQFGKASWSFREKVLLVANLIQFVVILSQVRSQDISLYVTSNQPTKIQGGLPNISLNKGHYKSLAISLEDRPVQQTQIDQLQHKFVKPPDCPDVLPCICKGRHIIQVGRDFSPKNRNFRRGGSI